MVKAGEKRADVYLSLGAAYLDASRVDAGLEILSQATHLDPARPDIRVQLARAYRLKGMLDKAEAQLPLAAPQGHASVASPFVQQRQLEFDLYLEQGQLKATRTARSGGRRLSQGPRDESCTRADEPGPRRRLSVRAIRARARVRSAGGEARISPCGRQAKSR